MDAIACTMAADNYARMCRFFLASFHFSVDEEGCNRGAPSKAHYQKKLHVHEMVCKGRLEGRPGGWTRRVEKLFEGQRDGQLNAWISSDPVVASVSHSFGFTNHLRLSKSLKQAKSVTPVLFGISEGCLYVQGLAAGRT